MQYLHSKDATLASTGIIPYIMCTHILVRVSVLQSHML